jgi:ABC-2 type transport system permease protein
VIGIRRALFLYTRFMAQHLKSVVEYQASFVIMFCAGILMHVPGLVFLWVIYAQIPAIQGWRLEEALFLYAMIFFTEGMTSFFIEGTWKLSFLAHNGGLDRYLLRPAPPLLQVLGDAVGMHGIGPILIGAALLWQSLTAAPVAWTPGRVALVAALLVSALVIRGAIILASNAAVFWVPGLGVTLAVAVGDIGDFAKYPLTIYALGVQALITWVLPFAFISFYPAALIFGRPEGQVLGWLTPLVAVVSGLLALGIFRAGLRRYESTGH